ncbi:MAG: hypothetical protein J2P34_01000 [Actinobacteria bacterium]|nr:hypothetical protein [Actinomycetota bacterium]
MAGAGAALTALIAGCGAAPLYGPAEPGTHPSPTAAASVSLQRFRQAETGPAARAFQADAARFNRDSKGSRVPQSALGEDAYQVSGDISRWAQAIRRAPVPPAYRRAKARLLHGLALLQQGYRHIGDGLLYQDAGQLSRGRAEVRAGSRMLGSNAGDLSV